jgi:hypothetical protein
MYTAGGGVSSYNDPVEYQFDWGDGTKSGWLPAGAANSSHIWTTQGTYQLTVQARCAAHPGIATISAALQVTIAEPETMSVPTVTGPSSTSTAERPTYTVSGGVSTYGDPVQYRIHWGDGTDSGWMPAGSVSASHNWSSANTYAVGAEARCANHPTVTSAVSAALNVAVTATEIVLQNLLAWYKFDEGSGQQLTDYSGNGYHGTFGATADAGSDDPVWNARGLSFGEGQRYVKLPVLNANPSAYTVQIAFALPTESGNQVLDVQSGRLAIDDAGRYYTDSGWTGPRIAAGNRVMTYVLENDVARIYVGKTLIQSALPYKPLPLGGAIRIGSTTDGYFFYTGEVWYLAVYGGALAETDIFANVDQISSALAARQITIAAVPEIVLPPSAPTGPTAVSAETTATYSSGGATSNYGHPVQYRFVWGDNTTSEWLPAGTTTASHSWSSAGKYWIWVDAKCANDAEVPISSSTLREVVVTAPETISTPAVTGPNSGESTTANTYTASGATSSSNHPIQYRFSWGDGTDSGWLSDGVATASHSWSTDGTFSVSVQARCANDPAISSAVSSSLSVVIATLETVSTPSITGPNSGVTATTYTFTAASSTSSGNHPLQYQFSWGDGTNSGWLAAGTTAATHNWSTAGTFAITAQAHCANHPMVTSAVSGPVSVSILAPVNVTVTPTTATIQVSQTQQFDANTAVTWTISPNVGSISAMGLYTAPASIPSSPQTVTVTATSQADPVRSATATVTVKQPPAAPTGLTANATGITTVVLSWQYTQGPTPATGFRIYRSSAGTSGLLATITTMSTRGMTDSAGWPGTTYTYYAVAFNATDVSAHSNEVTVTTPPAPSTPVLSPPTNLRAIFPNTSFITLTWNGVSGAVYYIVQRSTDGVNWTLAGQPTSPTLRVTGLITKTSYMFRVIVSNTNHAADSPPCEPITTSTT